MKHKGFARKAALYLALFIALALTTGFAAASASAVVDFEGLAPGTIVDHLSSGNGISGDTVEGVIHVFGFNPWFARNKNAAMVYDATCSPGGTPESCSGGGYDLFKPELGNVLIVSRDLDPEDPDDSGNQHTFFEFDFSSWGTGTVTVESLDVLDIEDEQLTRGAAIELYSGGPEGELLATVPIPHTGDNGLATVAVGVSGVDFMRVLLNGSGAIDNLVLHPDEAEEVLYLVDTVENEDGISNLFRVDIDEASGQAVLTLLPNGTLNYDRVDTLAASADGAVLYFIDTDDPDGTGSRSILGQYDVASAMVTEIGLITENGEPVEGFDQAATSPDGTLYVTHSDSDAVYILNPDTAEATLVGVMYNQATGAKVNVGAGDIAFDAEGNLYMFVNRARTDAPRGLYLLDLANASGGVVNATHLGEGSDEHPVRGLAFRDNGTGDLVGSTAPGPDEPGELHVINTADASDIIEPLTLYYNGEPYVTNAGDMSIGPFASP